jgi:hypothetical protein
MTPATEQSTASLRRLGRGGVIGLMLVGLTCTGCGLGKAIREAKNVTDALRGNKATVDAFTTHIKSGEANPFEATYVTTGSAPATIVYAVTPPKGLAFIDTPSGASAPDIHLIVNSSGEYSCMAGTPVSCTKLGTTSAATQNQILDFYTPAHWVGFLNDFALAAAFAGDKVSSSSKTVNGFAMHCLDLVASGVAGTSTICTTAQDILGYVEVASDSTSFEITKYSTSPSASMFDLPKGATVTTEPGSDAGAQSGTGTG